MSNITDHNGYGVIAASFEKTRNAFAATVNKLNVVRLDPNGLQKSGLFTLAVLQGINCYREKPFLPDYVESLDIANSFDFYGFFKIPNYWFYPYNLENVDPVPSLNALERHLCKNLGLGDRDALVRAFAQESLQNYFDILTDNNWTCLKNEAEFNDGLLNVILEKIAVQNLAWNGDGINLYGFHPILKPSAPFKILADFSSMAVDIGCGAYFLDQWKLLDLGYYANIIGEYRTFRWVPDQILDDWIRGGLCFSFVMQMVQGARGLRDQNSSDVVKVKSMWQIAIAVTEFVFNFSVLIRCKPSTVYFLTAVAKGIGVLSVMFEPATEYFPRN